MSLKIGLIMMTVHVERNANDERNGLVRKVGTDCLVEKVSNRKNIRHSLLIF